VHFKKVVLLVIVIIIFISYNYLNNYDFLEKDKCWSIETNIKNLNCYMMTKNTVLLKWDYYNLKVDINNKVVYQLNNYGKVFLGLLIWPKKSYNGIVLGDEVKGNGKDKFSFLNDIIIIKKFIDNKIVNIKLKKTCCD